MSSRNRLLSYFLFVIGVVILAGAVFYYLHVKRPENDALASSVPQMIAGIPLSQVVAGEEAIENIQQLHGKGILLVDGAVAVYGHQNLILWVSDAGNRSGGEELTELMRIRINEGRSPFEERGDFELDGLRIYALDGLGQKHYYWRSGQLVIWLAADRELAEEALQEVVAFYR